MSSALNVITASFGGLREVTTSPLWQWDYGQILQITGLDLPQAFEVHFSNSRKSGETVTQIGTDSQVTIPDMYLTSGADIYAFVFLHDGLTDGETEYVIKIPVRERPEPSDIEPTPEQQDVITQAIAALNNAVTQTGADVIAAGNSATAASQSATAAQTAAQSAQGSATSASASASTASTAAATATTKASEAATSAASAASAKTAAETAETNAKAAQTASESAQASAESAAQTATTKASEAAASAASVGEAAQTATAKAAEATQAAENAEAAQQAVENMTVSSQTLSAGSQATVTKTESEGVVNLAFGIPQGDPAPVEMVDASVRDWLDEHPEATTTVEDGAITWPKLYSDVQTEINKKAPAILRQTTTAASSHTIEGSDLKIVSFVGNQYAFETAKCVNRKNYMVNMVSDTVNLRGVTIGRSGDKFYTLNGTATANGEEYLLWQANNANIPAGEYNFYFKVDTGNSIIKDENHTIYVSIIYDDGSSYRIVESAKIDSDITISFIASNHIKRIVIKIGVIKNDVFDGYTGWFGIYPADATFYDSHKVVNNGETYNYAPPSFDGSYIDGYMHKCNVTYAEDMFLQPERYGAISDGVADDTQALVDCFSAAAASGKQVIGYGTYKTSAPLLIDWQNADVYLRKIDYTGNQSAIVLTDVGTVFMFHEIQSSGDGIEFGNNSAKTTYARRCQIKGNGIYSDGNCIIAQPKTIYNTCEIRYLSSANSNCIIYPDPGTGEFRAGEYVFKSSSCHCPKGYVAHRINDSKVYNFTVEGDCKYGYLNPADCVFVGCRHGEQVDRMANRIFYGASYDNGPLIIFDSYTAYYSTSAFRYYTNGTLPWYTIDISAIQNYDSVSNPNEWLRLAYNGMTMGTAIRAANARNYENIGGEICFIGNHKVYIPRCRITIKLVYAEYDMALWESQNDADIAACIPMGGWGTDFITNVSHTDYRMCGSFGAVGYNDLTFTQVDGKTVTVYDKLGNVIFDGTNEGDGKWHLKCSIDRYSFGRMAQPTSWWCYDGTNETWEVEKIG